MMLCFVLVLLIGGMLFPADIQAQRFGDLRLIKNRWVFALDGTLGRLEIYHNYYGWAAVSHAALDLFEADLACVELGYLYANRVQSASVLRFAFDPTLCLTSLICAPSDTRLINCDYTLSNNCGPGAAVTCSDQPNSVRLASSDGRRSFSPSFIYRTTSISAGRLEILINDRWGSVCSDGFDINDAYVACRQLGSLKAVSYNTASNLGYPSIFSPIWLSGLECPSFGTNNLRTCPHLPIGRNMNCSHSQDVILSCLFEGNLRLVSDAPTFTLLSTGRLEIYLSGEWGTVCNDKFGPVEANTACKQLGFSFATEWSDVGGFGIDIVSASRRIWLDDVVCFNTSSTLLSCDHNEIGVHNCRHSQDVALTCVDSEPPTVTTAELEQTTGPTLLATNISIDANINANAGAVAGTVVTVFIVLLFIIIPALLACAIYYRKNKTIGRGMVISPTPDNAYAATATVVSQATSNIADPEPLTSEPKDLPHSMLQKAPPPSYDQAAQYESVKYPPQDHPAYQQAPPKYHQSAQKLEQFSQNPNYPEHDVEALFPDASAPYPDETPSAPPLS